jgi:Protein of unknown function (DUF3102)
MTGNDQEAPEPAPELSRESWAERITAKWRAFAARTLEAIFELGQSLIDAKAALPHGEWMAMVEADLPFGPRTAEKFMAIAGDSRLANLANPTRESILPPASGTLYELSRFSDDEWEAFAGAGLLKPDLQRQEVIEFREHRRQPCKPPNVVRLVHSRPAAPERREIRVRSSQAAKSEPRRIHKPEPKLFVVKSGRGTEKLIRKVLADKLRDAVAHLHRDHPWAAEIRDVSKEIRASEAPATPYRRVLKLIKKLSPHEIDELIGILQAEREVTHET